MKEFKKKPKYHNLNKTDLKKMKFKPKRNIIIKNIKIIIIMLLFLLLLIFFALKKFHIHVKNPIINNNNKKNKDIKACLCSIGKRENLYAKEYVNHYKKIGYNHVYIYDNNDEDGEKFEDVLQDEINSNFVTIVNIRGKIKGQCYVYIDCYEKHHKEYDWLSFFDMDEFLEVKANNIQEFLTSPRYDKCVVIKINFLFYSDNELLYYDNRTLEERFTKALYHHGNNAWSKVTVRGGIKENYWSIGCTPHTSKFQVTNCNSAGHIIRYKQGAVRPNFNFAYLKHYYTKTAEEYVIKSSRGSAFSKVVWNQNRKLFKFRLFFVYNKRTKEKVKLLKKLFNMTL